MSRNRAMKQINNGSGGMEKIAALLVAWQKAKIRYSELGDLQLEVYRETEEIEAEILRELGARGVKLEEVTIKLKEVSP